MVYVAIGIVVVLVLYAFMTYNSFVKLNNQVKEAFATMDVYFKKRWDLIPNVVETVKGYVQHERGTLEEIVNLRNGAYENMSQDDKIGVNQQLTAGIGRLLALAENYPELKANQNFMDLSSQLSKVEEDIANARKYYNAVVKNMNNKVQMFPSNIFAGIFGFKTVKMFETDAAEREVVKVAF